MAGLIIGSDMEHLSIVRVWDYRLGLYWGRPSRGRVSVSELMSSSMVTVLVAIPSAKESTVARRGLAQWHWEGIWVCLRVVSIFLVARLTTCYAESVIYIVSLDVIREATTTATKFDGVKVHWVILWC